VRDSGNGETASHAAGVEPEPVRSSVYRSDYPEPIRTSCRGARLWPHQRGTVRIVGGSLTPSALLSSAIIRTVAVTATHEAMPMPRHACRCLLDSKRLSYLPFG
jgi:hypothetical protein